jgi:hypothetical protein
MHIVFTLRRDGSDKGAVLTCDLLLQLRFAAPRSNVDEELRDACGDAIHSVRRRVAGGTGIAAAATAAP